MRKLSMIYISIGIILLLAAGTMASCGTTVPADTTADAAETKPSEEGTAARVFSTDHEAYMQQYSDMVSEEIQRIEDERYETMGISPDNYEWAYANLLWNILQTSDLEGLWLFNAGYLDENAFPELFIAFCPADSVSPAVVTICTYENDRVVLCGTYSGKNLTIRTDGNGALEYSYHTADAMTGQVYTGIRYSRLRGEESVQLNCMQACDGTEYYFIDKESVDKETYQMKIAENILHSPSYTDVYMSIQYDSYLAARSQIEGMFGCNIGAPEEIPLMEEEVVETAGVYEVVEPEEVVVIEPEEGLAE